MSREQPSHEHHEHMARRTTRGAAAMLAARFGSSATMLVSSAIVARHVTPEEYGLVAMVVAILTIASVLEDFGLGDAAVQREHITEAQLSALFWINVALGLTVSGLFAAAAPLLAGFYERDELIAVTLALSPMFLLAALGSQHRAIARRKLYFRQLAVNRILGSMVGAAATTAGALLGWGLWALVAGRLAGALAGLVDIWRITGWKPGSPRRTDGVGELVGFGASLVGTQASNSIVRHIDNIAIGRWIGAAALGAYDRAFNLMLLPQLQLNQPLAHSIVPVLARLQSDPAGFRKVYRGGCQVIAAVTFPTSIFLLVAAPAAVTTMYGPQWAESAMLLQALSIGGVFISLNGTVAWIYQSLGRSRRQLVWGIIANALIVAGIFYGLRYGALGVAVAISLVRAALWPISLMVCYRDTFLKLGETVDAMWRPMVASIFGGVAAWLADPVEWYAPLRLLTQAGVFGAVGFGGLCLLPGGLALIAQVRTLRRHLSAAPARGRAKQPQDAPAHPVDPPAGA